VLEKTPKRKTIESAINTASIHPFTNVAWIIWSSSHVLHLYMNKVYRSCINSMFDIVTFVVFFFLSNLYISRYALFYMFIVIRHITKINRKRKKLWSLFYFECLISLSFQYEGCQRKDEMNLHFNSLIS
jgi:hypothetical protein